MHLNSFYWLTVYAQSHVLHMSSPRVKLMLERPIHSHAYSLMNTVLGCVIHASVHKAADHDSVCHTLAITAMFQECLLNEGITE